MGYESASKAGRKSLLSAAVRFAISAAIMQLVSSGVETYALIIRPLVRQAIIDGGQSALLKEFSGTFGISTPWINKFCRRMNLVMRRATTAAQKEPENSKELVDLMGMRVAFCVEKFKILKQMVVNWDQTAAKFCPVAGVTRAMRGVRSVALQNLDDKKQITAVFGAAACGYLLPPQLIFGGGTFQSLPFTYFARGPSPGKGRDGRLNEGALLPERVAKFEGWCWSVTDNHWSTLVRF